MVTSQSPHLHTTLAWARCVWLTAGGTLRLSWPYTIVAAQGGWDWVTMTEADVRALIAEGAIDTVKIGAADLDGVYRGKRVPATMFLEGLEQGFAQCDVIYGWDIAEDLVPDLRFTGWETGYPDLIGHP